MSFSALCRGHSSVLYYHKPIRPIRFSSLIIIVFSFTFRSVLRNCNVQGIVKESQLARFLAYIQCYVTCSPI